MADIEIELDVPTVMRDGTILRADVHRPARRGPWPVLLHRTPYGKRKSATALVLDVLLAVSHGYIVVHQDTRGCFDSDGAWEPWVFERSDGYDTVEWAASLPGSNGAVGMFGASYTGNTQWNAALAAPPALRALAPQVTWSDPIDGLFSRGGASELGLKGAWSLQTGAEHIRKNADTRGGPSRVLNEIVRDYDELAGRTYWELPSGRLPAIRRNQVCDIGAERALCYPEVTDSCTVAGKHKQIDVPTFNIGGWYDIFLQGTLDNYVGMREAGKPSRLLVGPWTHTTLNGLSEGQVGDINFGLASSSQLIDLSRSLSELQLRWFDYWLRGVETGLTNEAPITIFVMGANQWRDEAEWPPARAMETKMYLRAGHGLSRAAPAADEGWDQYTYDPGDPVITHGGNLVMSTEFPAGAFDQRTTEQRPDVLVYSTEPLPSDFEVTGRLRMVLFAATDAPSTDWVVRLCDVDLDGVSRNVADGVLRVRGRPSEVNECEVDLWSTSMVFRAGHRIRIQITSSNFPRWDRNLNTGQPAHVGTTMRAAHQMIFHDTARSSHIVLPVVPNGS